MNRKEDIPEIAKRELAGLLDQAGGILYSSHETLKPGDVYLLGFNPGGEGGPSLIEDIDELLHYESNKYLDGQWENGHGSMEEGEATLQRRVRWIAESLGLDLREICASNLIFFQSRDALSIDYDLAQRCWPVHQAILEIVQPKVILAFGNSGVSPYSYLHRMYGGEQEYMPAGHGNWNLKGFRTSINGQSVYVAGLPHLSRYDPIGKDFVVSWLREKFETNG